jgi:hypothetical protein
MTTTFKINQNPDRIHTVPHMQHHFGDNLQCDFCQLHWESHQRLQQECPRWIRYLPHPRVCDLLRSYRRHSLQFPGISHKDLITKLLGFKKNADLNEPTLERALAKAGELLRPKITKLRTAPRLHSQLIRKRDPLTMSEFVPGTEIKKPTVQLLGSTEIHLFEIVDRVSRELDKAKVPVDVVSKYRTDAMSSDFENLLRVTLQWVHVK